MSLSLFHLPRKPRRDDRIVNLLFFSGTKSSSPPNHMWAMNFSKILKITELKSAKGKAAPTSAIWFCITEFGLRHESFMHLFYGHTDPFCLSSQVADVSSSCRDSHKPFLRAYKQNPILTPSLQNHTYRFPHYNFSSSSSWLSNLPPAFTPWTQLYVEATVRWQTFVKPGGNNLTRTPLPT